MFPTFLLLGPLLAAQVPAPTPLEESIARRRTPVVQVVEKAGPAVVNIATEIVVRSNPFARSRGPDSLGELFGAPSRRQREESLGSGVIIDASGLVLTNEHVVSRASNITITLSDRRRLEVDVVGADPAFDLAVLKIRNAPADLPVAELGTSSALMIGETVVAIGNPFGLSNTVTTGVVSALHRSVEVSERVYEDFVQTDAAINPGNSGGALLDIEGRLIGINTAIHSNANGIGFAIPVDKARAVVDEVLRYGEVRPAYTGIQIDPASLPGALVRAIHPNSPASEAGLSPGDRIVDVGGQEVKSGRAYRQVERSLVPGQRVQLTVQRPTVPDQAGGQRITTSFAVRELSRQRAAAMGAARLGLSVKPKGEYLAITDVDRRSNAARVGIRPGDLLLAIGGRRLASDKDFENIAAAIYDAEVVTVVVGRGGRAYYVNLELTAL